MDQYADRLRQGGVHAAHDASEEQGFYYRIPAVAQVRVERMTEVIAERDLVVAQLGFVAALPKQRTYQTQYKITLDPETGALKTLESSSDSVDPGLITGTGDAVAAALSRRAEAEKAEAAAQDELALLERERKILDETKKIRDLKKELGETEPPP